MSCLRAFSVCCIVHSLITNELHFMNNTIKTALIAPLLLAAAASAQTVVNFDDADLPPDSFRNDAGPSNQFVSKGVGFSNDYNAGFGSYDGFALSTVADSQTPGFGNQYASFPGGGAGGKAGGLALPGDPYAVAFSDSSTITLPAGKTAAGVMLSNTTYAALSMLKGDSFAKQFGGLTGDDPDFFSVTLTGRDGGGAATGAVTFFLADYRFADNAQDYVVNTWTPVDLTPLGAARTIGLSFASSDVGDFGINTPTYVALDDLRLVPEPSSLGLLALGGLLLRRRHSR